MLLESLVKATVELQEFRVVTVMGKVGGLVAKLAPDRRFSPRCGQCGERGWYRDTRRARHLHHLPLRLNNKAKLVIHKAYGCRTAKNDIRNLHRCLANLALPRTLHTFV